MPGFWEALGSLDIRTVIIGVLLLTLSTAGMLFFRAMLTGKLVPRAALDDERVDTSLWRQAHGESEKTRQAVADLLNKQSDLLGKQNDLLDKVIVQGAIANEVLNQLRAGVQR